MTIPDKFKAALNDPHAHVHTIVLSPELKERLNAICDKVIDLLAKECRTPSEAYMVAVFVKDSFEDRYGIVSGVGLTEGETAES